MKILIVSDSHGLERELADVLERHRDDVDLLIHCGDSELHKGHLLLNNVAVVKGNCDGGQGFQEEYLTALNGWNIYSIHGHQYNVKSSYVPLSYRAEEVGANLVCFGHSHVATAFEENGVVYVNPGSIHSPRNSQRKTYCICESNSSMLKVTFYDLTGEKIEGMGSAFAKNEIKK